MSGTESNPHIRNIPASINKPLYMECKGPACSVHANVCLCDWVTLIHLPSPHPVFDHLQYANMEGEGLEDLVACVMSGRQWADTRGTVRSYHKYEMYLVKAVGTEPVSLQQDHFTVPHNPDFLSVLHVCSQALTNLPCSPFHSKFAYCKQYKSGGGEGA